MFSTTLATASRLSTTTIRRPTRSELWSSMLEMPAILPSRTCSAMEVMKLSWLTWYGSSVITKDVLPLESSSISATPRMRMEPRPVV
ncbi:Uncharacterised protein [Mycobacteroides abscessus subsp. abscessus]|nr:Uncharacterised protein [Mycobacteroides abscessus subsp. abscessus]